MSYIPTSEPNASFPGSRKKNVQQTRRFERLWKALKICGDSRKLTIGNLHLDVYLDVQRRNTRKHRNKGQNKIKKNKKSLITVTATHCMMMYDVYIYIHFPCPPNKKVKISRYLQNFNLILYIYINEYMRVYIYISTASCEPSWWS